MNEKKIIYSNSLIETFDLGKKFIKYLYKNCVIGLIGDLGSGKTGFVKGVVSSFGYDINRVSSPTFTIINVYKTKIPIFHFDLYRIENIQEFETIGFYDYLDLDGICFIEWVNNLNNNIKRDMDIKISIENENSRKFEFIPYTDKFKDFLNL